jgi:multicomponent Na+:H+ antiporter subunit G
VIGEALLLAGALLTLVAAVGVVRFDHVLTRTHALSKATSLGVLLALAGAAASLGTPATVTSVVLVAGLQMLTSPVGAALLARAVYRTGPPSTVATPHDELAVPDQDHARHRRAVNLRPTQGPQSDGGRTGMGT